MAETKAASGACHCGREIVPEDGFAVCRMCKFAGCPECRDDAPEAACPAVVFAVYQGEYESDLSCLHVTEEDARACASTPGRHERGHTDVFPLSVFAGVDHDPT